MGMIRQTATGPALKDAIVLNLGDLSREAHALAERARAEADRILAEARQERQRLIESASGEGYAQGHAEGLARGREEGQAAGKAEALAEYRERLGAIEAGWSEALSAFVGERGRLLADARADVVRLAVLLAERLTKRRLELDPGLVVDQVESVLRLVARPTRLVIRLHPLDLPLVREAMPNLLSGLPLVEHVELVTDAGLERGSCVATTAGGGMIEASIGAQLERLAAELLPERGGAAGKAA
jgi:flagellar biosynthesis/type III secretory pathway protein FliH